MAGKARRKTAPVSEQLFENPRAYSFVQVLRLLKLMTGQTSGKALQEFYDETLRVRAHLSLGFPGTDVSDLEREDADGKPRYRITATFMGLYGASSPLPTFYTEDLLDEAREDKSGLRDFLDIFNNDFFIKLYRAWARNRLAVRIAEEKDESSMERAFCLIGMGHSPIRERFSEAYRALRYTGLYTQYPRSALGLKTILSDRLNGAPVRVDQCLPEKVSVPEDQRLLLGLSGNVLGEETVLGSETADRMGKIGITVGPLEADEFQGLLPGSPLHSALKEHVELYQMQPFPYDLTLIVKEREYSAVSLGGDRWSRLGHDTWLYSGDVDSPGTVTFAGSRHRGCHAAPA
jgi:type VI secretion system protein ImpH